MTGAQLIARRRRLWMTQQQLADLAGISAGTLCRLEADLRKPAPRTARRLEAALIAYGVFRAQLREQMAS